MLWVYTITDSNLRMGIMESFLSFLKSLGYEARIQNIYYQECIYIAYAPPSAIFKPGDNIYFIVDSDAGWASFNNNFSCAVWNRVDKAQYHEWCKQRIYKKFPKKTTQFKNLNTGDIFKIPTQEYIYIKTEEVGGKWEAIILTGTKKGYSIYFIPETEVEIVKNAVLTNHDKGDLSGAYKSRCRLDFMTYGGVPMDVINYSKADCEATWRLYKEMGNTIKKVIFNDPATIVIWGDGSKTVVKAQKGEKFDKEKGLALCYMKKTLGNQSNFNNVFREWIKPEPTCLYDKKHPELGIQDLSPKGKKVLPSGRYRIRTSELKLIKNYIRDNLITYDQIASATALSAKTVKRALEGLPISSTTKHFIENYFTFPIEFTIYAED